MPLKPLDRESEPYSQYGNISADGIQRLLGTPHLDALQVLIRETVQNSWDAGKDIPGPVDYRIRLRELCQQQKDSLRDTVFQDLPAYERNPGHSIREVLASKRITAIEICDFGTTGLGGPISPEQVPAEGDSPDFVDFVRNIGSPRDTVYGGGTYGYGKSCLFGLSQCRSILIDSVTHANGGAERRFMACRVASRYDIGSGAEKGRYTGRHWWGRYTNDSMLGPVTGADASALSSVLGMCERASDDFGTSILILAPALDVASLKQAGAKAIQILLWYCWPKMIALSDTMPPPMTFSVEVNGDPLDIPHPDDCPPLNLFASSLREVRTASSGAIPIASKRPVKHLGYLNIKRGLRADRLPHFTDDETSFFPRVSSHVALMRPAELVVKYAIGEPLPSDDVEWAGVFVCSEEEEVEQAFAAAEPPAHDDWDPTSLVKGHKKTFVNVALRRIREQMSAVSARLETTPSPDADRSSLGAVADLLGSMLSLAGGQRLGKASATRTGKRGHRRQAVSVSRPVFVDHDLRNGKQCAIFEFRVTSRDSQEILLAAAARILKDGGGADEEDARKEQPTAVYWRRQDGTEFHQVEVRVVAEGEQDWRVSVTLPEGKAISLTVNTKEPE